MSSGRIAAPGSGGGNRPRVSAPGSNGGTNNNNPSLASNGAPLTPAAASTAATGTSSRTASPATRPPPLVTSNEPASPSISQSSSAASSAGYASPPSSSTTIASSSTPQLASGIPASEIASPTSINAQPLGGLCTPTSAMTDMGCPFPLASSPVAAGAPDAQNMSPSTSSATSSSSSAASAMGNALGSVVFAANVGYAPVATSTPTSTNSAPSSTNGSSVSIGPLSQRDPQSLTAEERRLRQLQADEERAAKEREALQKQQKSRIYRKLFELPDYEELIEDYSCAIEKAILLHGRMYVSKNYVCFYSNIFSHKTQIVIPIKDVSKVDRANIALVIPNSIKIYMKNGDTHFFASFMARDETFLLIHSLVHGKPIPLIANRPASGSTGSNNAASSSSSAAATSALAAAAAINANGNGNGVATPSAIATPSSKSDDGSYWGQPSTQLEPAPLAPTPVHGHGHGHGHGHHGSLSMSSTPASPPSSNGGTTERIPLLSGSIIGAGGVRTGRSLSVDAQLERPDRKSLERDAVVTGEPIDTMTDSVKGIELLPIPDKRISSSPGPVTGAAAGGASATRTTTPGGITVATAVAFAPGSSATTAAGAGSGATAIESKGESPTGPRFTGDDGTPIYEPRTLKKAMDYAGFRPPVPTPADAAKQDMDKCHEFTFPNISKQMFMDFFLCDDAPCPELDWHKTRETDKATEYGEWVEMPDQSGGAGYARDTAFRTLIIGAPFGPPETRVHKVERIYPPANETAPLVLHAFAVTPDVPFGDLFYMYSRWTINDVPTSNGQPSCKVVFDAQMVVFKSTFAFRAAKGIARGRAMGDLAKSFSHWTSFASSWLNSPLGQKYIAAHTAGYYPRRPGQLAPPPSPIEIAAAAAAAAAASAAAAGPVAVEDKLPQGATPPMIDVSATSAYMAMANKLATPLPTPRVSATPRAGTSSVGAGAGANAAASSDKKPLADMLRHYGAHGAAGVVAFLFMLFLRSTVLSDTPGDAVAASGAALSRVTIALLLILAGLSLLLVIGHRRMMALEQCMSTLIQQRDETNQLLRTLTQEIAASKRSASPANGFAAAP